jgi:phosphohistidine phosphatase SixA
MKLYLIQHGEAKSEAEDPERSLTARGEKEVVAVSKVAGDLRRSITVENYERNRLRRSLRVL